MITSYRVVRRLREPQDVSPIANTETDFELEPDAEGAAEELLARPHVSLYSLDHAHRRVTFVRTDSDTDLAAAPFLHQAQRNAATHVFAVPYAEFHAFAAAAPRDAAPPIIVHSVGRCGSTLLSAMLHAVPGVASVAEPDVLTAVETEIAAGSLSRDDAVAVLRSACHLAGHGLAAPGARPAIKVRSEVAWIARLLDEAVPGACTLFMYRDARRVIESYLRVLGRRRQWSDRLAHVPGLDRVVAARHARRVERRGPRMERFGYVLGDCDPLEIEKRGRWGKFLIQWLAKVHAYEDLRTLRPDVAALRYEDLVADPERVLGAVFAHCGLPTETLPGALAVMSRDSQRGTAYHRDARESWAMSALDEREMARTFRECTTLTGPDAILPGTLR